MATDSFLQEADLADLLTTTVKAVVKAQDALDDAASKSATIYAQTPAGTLALPPLWYTVKDATVEVEMSASISETGLVCRLLDPSHVALFGYQAASGTRVRLSVGPHGTPHVKPSA